MKKITKDMRIGEVVNKYPSLASILFKHGLHCVGCSISPFETIENGCMGHGMDPKSIDDLIIDMNKEVENIEKDKKQSKSKFVIITEKASEKLKEKMKKENKYDYGVRLSIDVNKGGKIKYGLGFAKSPKVSENTFEDMDIKIFVEKTVMSMVKGTVIDYAEDDFGSGFKISNSKTNDN